MKRAYGVAVGTGVGWAHSAQQVLAVPTVPPRARQRSSDDLILHFDANTQSASAAQTSAGSSTQVPVTRSQVPISVGITQVTKFALPQVERAAQRCTFP